MIGAIMMFVGGGIIIISMAIFVFFAFCRAVTDNDFIGIILSFCVLLLIVGFILSILGV